MANGNGSSSSVKVIGGIALALITLMGTVIKTNGDAVDEMRQHYVTKQQLTQDQLAEEKRWSAQDRKLDRIESKLEALSLLLKRIRG